MNKQTFPLSWLTVVIVSILLIAACTAKLQGSSNEPNNATATSTTKADEPIDTTLTLEKLIRKNYPRSSILTNEYNLDTSITNHLPHFNAQELLTYYRFLFDLGKDDSMYCQKCNDSSYIKRGSNNYEYYYYYKKIPVGEVIDLQTNYGDDKIYRVRVGYKRLKDLDVTPQMSIKEATKKAIEALRFEQSLARVEKGGWNYYTGVDTPYYSGLSISLNKLYHNFIWHRNWSMMVEDKTGITLVYDKTGHNRLCDACDFSTATYTTQTVPTYSNANFNYGNVPLEAQECAYTLGDNMLKRYRLQQNANPFHVVYQSATTELYGNTDYEEADWYSVPNLNPIDPAITVQDIKTVNGVISATVTGLVFSIGLKQVNSPIWTIMLQCN